MVNVLDYGAVPNNTSFDNSAAFQAAITQAKSIIAPVYVPAGTYTVRSTINAGDVKGFIGDGITASTIQVWGSNPTTLSSVLDVTNMSRGTLRDFGIDANNKANIGIISNYTLGIGPSLNFDTKLFSNRLAS